ncbi:unnamed protein product [Chironomus riparius]|uniref:Uncharacterized protein n=1 Tax=Chironomus riparius TaxID=315576 RepID=A0A9N9RYZ5_9DIPT|nr:unnamed protein product [Chironomus riparius]
MKEPLEPKNFDTVHLLCGPLGLKRSMLAFVGIKLVLAILGIFLPILQIILILVCKEYTYLDPGIKNLTPITFCVLLIIFNTVNAIVFFFFVQAVRKEHAASVLPYLVLNGVYIIFYTFITVAAMSPFMFLGLLFYLYIYLCAFSLYTIFSDAEQHHAV